MEILAKRLLEMRKFKGLRQEDAAKELGISFNSYCRYEHGQRDPDAPIIAAMAEFFGVSAAYLLGLTDTPKL